MGKQTAQAKEVTESIIKTRLCIITVYYIQMLTKETIYYGQCKEDSALEVANFVCL